ncbi:YXWGXW repeat-containing protein [Azohydromonas sediminis]|uniref:YXWGXW repeat-containing protein n=1 Tax=Azohydromonas sediminis TaxID=2259674 RepID=UPI000E646A6B|nr:YXWGXW repeat-containing protein [Azohydromonas sediminis]
MTSSDTSLWRRVLGIAAVAAAAFGLAGCTIYPAGPHAAGIVVTVPPPQPEVPGSPPVVGYVWISGFWNWVGTRYVWVPGYWSPLRPGHVWVPHRWERGPHG